MQKTPSKAELERYIRESAIKRGIDPDIAVRVARAEGLNANPADGWQSNVKKGGRREPSFGPYQLNTDGGLGSRFMKDTGLDLRDPSTAYAQIDYALDEVTRDGWAQWYGARDTGISRWQGISSNAKSAGVSPQSKSEVASLANIPTPVSADRGVLSAYAGDKAGQPFDALLGNDPTYIQGSPQNYDPQYVKAVTPTPAPRGPSPLADTQFNARFGASTPTVSPPQMASASPLSGYFAEQVAANPESMSPEEYAAWQDRQSLMDPAFGAPVPPISVSPLTPPQNVKQYQTAGTPAQQPAAAPAPPPPSGMDVWQGNSPYGVATDKSTLSRNPDGTVSRYSEQFDRWDTFNPTTNQWTPGGGQSGGIPMPDMPNIGMPSKNRMMQGGKTLAGGAAGGVLGSMLAGPLGGLLGAALGRSVMQGKGLGGILNGRNFNKLEQQARGALNQTTAPYTPGLAFPNAPSSPGGNERDFDYERARSISPAAADAIRNGRGGLF